MATRDHNRGIAAIWLAALVWACLLLPATAQQAPTELASALGDTKYRYRGEEIKRRQFATMFKYVFGRFGIYLPNDKLMNCRKGKSNSVRVLGPSDVTGQAGVLIYSKVIDTYPHGLVVQAYTKKRETFTAYVHVDQRIAQKEFDLPSRRPEGQLPKKEKKKPEENPGTLNQGILNTLRQQIHAPNKPYTPPQPKSYPLVVRNGRYQSPDQTAVYPRFDALGQMTEESFASWLKDGGKLYHEVIRKRPSTVCKTCAGSGKVVVRKASRNRLGWNRAACGACRGSGKLTGKPRKMWTSSWRPDDVIPPK